MISSQKIIAMIILINLIIGIALEVQKEDEETPEESLETTISLVKAEQEKFKSDEGIWGSVKARTSQVYESTIRNVISWGSSLLNIFIQGLNPFSITRGDYNTPIERMIADMILAIRSIMISIVMLEIYLIFKNKKAT